MNVSKPRVLTHDDLLAYCSFVPFSGCYVWIDLSLKNDGYGQVTHSGRKWSAHKLSYVLAKGPVPDGLVLDHLCRVRCCINPDHLEPVTDAVNVARGISAQTTKARRAAQTHCPNGHEYTVANTRISPLGGKKCRACQRDLTRKYRAAERGSAA
jgi:hypothetical protein